LLSHQKNMDKNKFYITTAIPYVNAGPHVGHALEFVQTDVLARYHRLRGEESFLLTGSDENALKNVRAANKEGVSTQELVDRNTGAFKNFAHLLNIDVSGFERGSDKTSHWPGVHELWNRAFAKGDIYKKSYKGLYCIGHEAFITEKELDQNGFCPDHNAKPEEVEEENYFFKLSKYQDELLKLIEADEYRILPQSRKNEIVNFIKGGLEDFSISRSKERANGWGIPVPDDESQVVYVWFDALAIYLTGAGFGTDKEKFESLWPADTHVIGKDIIRFHAVYWPAMLLSSDLALPKELFVHGFITSKGQKMSKTLGNVIDPLGYVEKYGADPLRYYLLSEIPTFEDGDFTDKRFIERYNGDLAKGLGNVSARILTLADGVDFSQVKKGPGEIDEAQRLKEVWQKYGEAFSQRDLKKALEEVWQLIHWIDGYIEEKKPWENKDTEVLYALCVALANVSWLLRPFLPETAEKISAALGISGKEKWEFDPRKIDALFPKIEE